MAHYHSDSDPNADSNGLNGFVLTDKFSTDIGNIFELVSWSESVSVNVLNHLMLKMRMLFGRRMVFRILEFVKVKNVQCTWHLNRDCPLHFSNFTGDGNLRGNFRGGRGDRGRRLA